MIYRCAGSAGDRLVKVYEREGGKNAAKKEGNGKERVAPEMSRLYNAMINLGMLPR